NITAAGATGVLKDVRCSGSPGITVTVDPLAFSGSAGTNGLRVSLIAGLVPVLDVPTTTATPSINGPAQDIVFNYPAEFSPPAASKHIGSQPIGLQSLTTITTGTPVLLGALPLSLTLLGINTTTIVNALVSTLHTVLGDLDNNIVTPLTRALGVDIGGADVTALASAYNPASCGQPRLVS